MRLGIFTKLRGLLLRALTFASRTECDCRASGKALPSISANALVTLSSNLMVTGARQKGVHVQERSFCRQDHRRAASRSCRFASRCVYAAVCNCAQRDAFGSSGYLRSRLRDQSGASIWPASVLAGCKDSRDHGRPDERTRAHEGGAIWPGRACRCSGCCTGDDTSESRSVQYAGGSSDREPRGVSAIARSNSFRWPFPRHRARSYRPHTL